MLALLLASAELFVRFYFVYSDPTQRLSPREYIASFLNTRYDHSINPSSSRYPVPYISFKGRPNVTGHDQHGYKNKLAASTDPRTVTILFMGGSTGYLGTPNLPELLEKELQKSFNIRIINLSAISQNHRQHLHNLLEDASNYQFDIVLFYGGYNETLQSAYYDPRPGFPYNYALRTEASPENAILYKHSLLFRLIVAKKYGSIYKYLGITEVPFTPSWNAAIFQQYLATLAQANRVAPAVTSARCKVKFLAAIQPYNIHQQDIPPSFHQRYLDAAQQLSQKEYGINSQNTPAISASSFTDVVHLTHEGRVSVATYLSSSLKLTRAIKSCT